MIRVICVKLFFRSIAPRPSRSPAEKSRPYRLPKTTANPAPNGRPLSQSRWTTSANRCSTDRTVHGCVDFNIAGREKTLAAASLLVTRARPQKRFQAAFRRGKQRLYSAHVNVPRHQKGRMILVPCFGGPSIRVRRKSRARRHSY